MKPRMLLLVLAALLVSWLGKSGFGDIGGRLPEPAGAGLDDANKKIQEVYGDELNAASDGAKQAEVSHKLLAAGKDEKDMAARYALLIMARDQAERAGDAATTSAAIDLVGAAFDIDALQWHSAALKALSGSVQTTDQRRALSAYSYSVVEAAVVADRYPLAREVVTTVRGVADDATALHAADAKAQEVETDAAAFASVKEAEETLKSTPDDASANAKVGRFTCFIHADWERGLPMLAIGNDAALKALAATETAGVQAADAIVKLGDGWWRQADPLYGAAKRHVQAHAAAWYREVLPELPAGLAKTVIQKRVALVQSMAQADPVRGADGGAGNGPQGLVTFYGLEGKATRIVLVIDHSGSMVEKMDFVKEQAKQSVSMLKPNVFFAVISFDEHAEVLGQRGVKKPELWNATDAHKEAVIEKISEVRAEGANDDVWEPFAEAFQTAFAMRPQMVFFLTDGAFDPKFLAVLRKLNASHQVKINTIAYNTGAGGADSHYAQQLRELAKENGGRYKFVSE